MDIKQGLILKSSGGLNFVECDGEIIQCKARGKFRKEKISPCAGDNVIIEKDEQSDYIISEILPRKNHIIRPPLSNIDYIVFVISTCEPTPNFQLVDKFTAIAEYKNIQSIIVITKNDLKKYKMIEEIYKLSGFQVFVVDYEDESSYLPILDIIKNKLTVFIGNTGAGKSTLLNHLDKNLTLETGEISKKLGRGRHTTRQVELFKNANGGYIADSPGFSTFETNQYDIIVKDKLKLCFPEFKEYEGKCMFQDCMHYKEKGCAVIEAVKQGKIHFSRHESYKVMFEEAKNIKEWENK